jgi:hypothetical protein
MLEHTPALEDLDEAEPRDVVGAHAVDTAVAELDGALVTLPRSLPSTPEIAFSVVVLPAPLPPSRVVMLPSRTSIDTP